MLLSKTEDWARFLDRNLRNLDFRNNTNGRIDQSLELIREGNDLKQIQAKLNLGKKEASIIFELAHSRIRIQGKFERWNRLWMDQYLASYSTPEIVCRYRAGRIEDFDIIEAGSGAGMQSIFLSMANRSTLSVEIQPERYRMARLNALEYKTGKLDFVNGDIYTLSSKVDIDSNTLIFSDPARPQTEGERAMSSLIPSPENLIRIFGDRTENFVFDLPPQMKWENIGIPGEKEYLSIDGKLNRLTLYCGRLARGESSAIMLPGNIRVSGNPGNPHEENPQDIMEYILVPDVSIVYARLLWKVQQNFDVHYSWKDARRYFFTSHKMQDEFPGEQYEVLSNGNFESLNESLKRHDGGRVFLRFPADDHEYYEIKRKLESGLSGDTDLYVFRRKENFCITKKVQ